MLMAPLCLAVVVVAGAGTPPAPLNHFFVVPDAETFAAMKASPFLRDELAVFEERTTVRNDTSYTGIYFYGRNTYFEFLPPEAARPAGSAGVAFGLESEAASADLESRFAKVLGPPVGNFVVTRRVGAEDVPWFRMVGVETKPDAPFATWSMEYDPPFLARWYPEFPPASRAITRANVLSRYAAKLGQADTRDARWLRDVTGLTLALDDAERAAFLPQLEVYGYRLETRGTTVVAHGPDVTLTIRPASPSERGVVEAQLSVKAGAPPTRELRVGRSILTFTGDGTARWRFGP